MNNNIISKKEEAQSENSTVPMEIRNQFFSGPLPPPAILAQFDSIVPGSAERIIRMAENQAGHRISLEKSVIQSEIRQAKIGQLLGFIIAITGLIGSLVIISKGHTVGGTILGGATLGSLVSVFIHGTAMRRTEREGKEGKIQKISNE